MAGEKIRARYVQRRSHQSADIELRVRTEQDAVLVQQEQPAHGIERSVEACGIDIADPDQHRRIGPLDDIHRFIVQGIEPLSVDNRTESRGCNGQVRRADTLERYSGGRAAQTDRIGQYDRYNRQLEQIEAEDDAREDP
ncbi:MAG: hypothetical protein JW395_1400 [Nitrospira sp.]|nr:hypothetical protein [Nitrospira sp.]